MRICSGPGCGRAVPDDVRFCDECKGASTQEHKTGAERAKQDPFMLQYQSRRWRNSIKGRVLQAYPLCVECKRNASAVADHEIPARLIVRVCRNERLFPFDPWGGFYIFANLRGRCHACHNKKTRIEDGQDWTAQLDIVLAPFRAARGPVTL